MENAELTAAILREIHVLGVRVCIDQFGSSAISVSQLARLPLGGIKLARSIVHDETSRPVAGALVAMARRLGLEVVASVSNLEDVEWARAESCAAVQGFCLSPPLPAGRV